MQLFSVTKTDSEALEFIKPLYETSFPLNERRDWVQLVGLLDYGQMNMYLIKDAAISVGFGIYWMLNDWHYLEHFAVDISLRGKQYGSRAMQLFLKKADRKLVLEVEHANNMDSQRRIEFYQRLGMQLVEMDYHQPPYRKEGQAIPMHLMVGERVSDFEAFKKVVELIREKVYEHFWP